MYSKNSPQRRPTGAKLRSLVAISVSSQLLLAVGAASAQTGRPGNFRDRLLVEREYKSLVTSVYSSKFLIVFRSCAPLTSRLRQMKGWAFSCQASQKS
jgi:hypothetical protein